MSSYCICHREDYTLTEYHYARCLVCYQHIPYDEVMKGWRKINDTNS